MERQYIPRDIREMLEEEVLRELLERYPDLMPVVGRMDADMDSIGSRTLVEAARLHGFEPELMLDEAARVITRERQ